MTIASTIASLTTTASTIYPTLLKWAAIVGAILLLCVLSFLYGDHIGGASQVAAQAKADVKVQQQTITQIKTQTVLDTTQVLALQKQLDALTAKNIVLSLQVKSAKALTVVVPATPTVPASCKFGPDWVNAYNQSLQK